MTENKTNHQDATFEMHEQPPVDAAFQKKPPELMPTAGLLDGEAR